MSSTDISESPASARVFPQSRFGSPHINDDLKGRGFMNRSMTKKDDMKTRFYILAGRIPVSLTEGMRGLVGCGLICIRSACKRDASM